jgi:hypothetical protein
VPPEANLHDRPVVQDPDDEPALTLVDPQQG